jgi:hypothetical protein
MGVCMAGKSLLSLQWNVQKSHCLEFARHLSSTVPEEAAAHSVLLAVPHPLGLTLERPAKLQEP